ncbi:hypothetical protein [Sphingomicrobium clamense]|uniref:Uncharacterized protein n=1 Tax=Sphingomicrobium clamense TaxID=2851013 RepID=A0ABS6V5B5_9SPHN|nr:hypothetical protein [Sphingomicrobium sp. B8]MBW0144745.1 hypothetical protein [Sphingomicrobium sp. B8]
MWTKIFLSLLAIAPDPAAGDERDDTVEFECPDDLTGQPDLIVRKCREALAIPATGASGKTIIILPVAAAAAAGVALAGLKSDPPVSR